MAATCEPIATMRSQNSTFSAPAGPAVSTNENLEGLGSGTRAFSHSDARAQRRPQPATIGRRPRAQAPA